PDAEEQRYLADELMQIDDERRLLRRTSDFDRGVHRQGCRAGATLDAEKREHTAVSRAVFRPRPLGRSVDGRVKGIVYRPGEIFVGPGAHRLKDLFGL